MKNKKGFTLIELLSVIVILAIIALIATPIILNTIEKARKNAAKDSAYGYIEAIETQNTLSQLYPEKYSAVTSGDVSSINSIVKVKGTKPTSGTVTIENGHVTSANLTMKGYELSYDGKVVSILGSSNSSNEPAPVVLSPGLYDDNDNLIESYDDLVSKYSFNPSASMVEDDDHMEYEYDSDDGWYYRDGNWHKVLFSEDDELKGIPFVVLSNNEYRNVKKIVLPDTVTSIGEKAFNDTNITSIIISTSVTSIGNNAFDGVSKLSSVTFENGSQLTSIGDEAFKGTSLTSINIPASVTSIGKQAFAHATPFVELRNVTFENGSHLTSVGDRAFAESKIKSITIPSSVTSIGTNAVLSVSNLYYTGSATSSNNWGATNLNPYADGEFLYRDNTKKTLVGYTGTNTSITLPNGITSIGGKAFYKSNLESVIIPSGVTKIEYAAFAGTQLQSLTIPSSVTTIEDEAFYAISTLTSATFENGSQLISIGGHTFQFTGISSITIPSSVTTIGNYAFGGITNLYYTGTATDTDNNNWGATNLNP